MKNINSQRGSIALISLLLISVMAMILVVGASETSISTSYQYVNNSSGKASYYLAEGCLEEAITRLESDDSFTGTTIPQEDYSSCTVVVTGSSPKTITITVDHLDYSQTFQGTVDLTAEGVIYNADLSGWQEV